MYVSHLRTESNNEEKQTKKQQLDENAIVHKLHVTLLKNIFFFC